LLPNRTVDYRRQIPLLGNYTLKAQKSLGSLQINYILPLDESQVESSATIGNHYFQET
jgi:hypothetical protein